MKYASRHYGCKGAESLVLTVFPLAEITSAAIAVQYRDGWFYIKDNDLTTKGFFRFLATLWTVKIAESTANSEAAPVLTIPVSR